MIKRLLTAALMLTAAGSAWADPSMTADASKPQTNRLIVGFKPGTSAAEREQILKDRGLLAVADGDLDPFNALIVDAPQAGFQPAAMRLKADPQIFWVEEDFYYPDWLRVDGPMAMSQVPLPGMAPFRQMLKEAPAINKPLIEGELPWGITKVNAPAAWAKHVTGKGVKVAVVDTGIDFKNPDVAPNYKGGINYVDSKKEPLDDHGHGTHVSGTIAAVKDGKGVVGVAPEAGLYAVKVLDKNGGGTLTSVIKGILWCANNGMDVANFSLGSPTGSMFEHWAIMYARSKGVAIIAAAGNEGPGENTVGYPGGYEEVLGIAASDVNDHVAEFSSRGKQVDFIAPGVDVWSDQMGSADYKLAMHSGTSMATPHMSGLAALAVSQGAHGVDAVRAAFMKARKPLAGLSETQQGAGLVDADLLVK